MVRSLGWADNQVIKMGGGSPPSVGNLLMVLFYKFLGFSAIGLGAVNLIALLSSLYNPLLGISILLPLTLVLLGWSGVLIWQLTKTEKPEVKNEILGSLGESFGLFVLMILGIMAGVA